MKSIGKLIAVILISSIAFSACKKPLEYPLVPNIDFKSIVGVKDANGKDQYLHCLLYTSPSPRDRTRSRMPSSA